MDVKEFSFRLPQTQRKKYSVMQFNRSDNVDLTKWQQAKMERENNLVQFKSGTTEELPKFGAGSEFGREWREEARQKKYGIVAKKYKEEDQPWILKQGGDSNTAKKFKGKKAGLVNENSCYFILAQLADGTFEAYPVDSWYNFTSMKTYRTLNAEEAEEEFGRRDKTFNYFSLMVQKKLRDNKEDEDKEENKTKKSLTGDLTIMEDDYYLMSDEELEDSDDEGGRGKSKGKKGKGKGQGKNSKKPKRPKKKDLDSEAEEESDEGDFDGREFDYMSEESSDEEEEIKKTDIKGLDQELQQMEDEEEEEEDEKKKEEELKKPEETSNNTKEKKNEGDSSSESSGSDSDIDENKIQSAMLLQKKNSKKVGGRSSPKPSSGSQSRSQTPTVMETSAAASTAEGTLTDAAKQLENPSKKRPKSSDSPANKKLRTESPVQGISSNRTPSGHVPLTEDEVRRYLMRRPMTTKDLLVKLNPKRTGLPKDQIETKLAEILVKLAPEQRKKDSKIYWFIREHAK